MTCRGASRGLCGVAYIVKMLMNCIDIKQQKEKRAMTMKKRFIRSLSSKALAAAVGAAVLIQAQAPVLAGALDSPLYISEV